MLPCLEYGVSSGHGPPPISISSHDGFTSQDTAVGFQIEVNFFHTTRSIIASVVMVPIHPSYTGLVIMCLMGRCPRENIS